MALHMISVLGQATFLLDNLVGLGEVNAPVFDAEGVPLAGENYRAELWGGSTPDALDPAQVLQGGARLFVPFTTRGYFSSTEIFLSIPSSPPGGFAWLQVRAWDVCLGSTYEEVVALSLGGYGESPIFFADGGDPFNQFPEPGRLIGLQSFSLRAIVPEPSPALLLLFALPFLLLRRLRSPRFGG